MTMIQGHPTTGGIPQLNCICKDIHTT